MILLRATTLTERTVALADELAAASGEAVAFLLDGRHPVEVATNRPIVSLTQAACEELGLYCPPDFAWRCGDYGVYLARRQFPQEPRFWLIEYDVRLAGGPAHDFFNAFATQPDIDFLACHLGPAGPDWDWRPHAMGRGVKPYRCLFTVVRLSARALDQLLAGRVRQARRSQRRKTWPNDEAFVATTLGNQDFVCRDINAFGRTFYTSETNSISTRFQGETFAPPQTGVCIYHPVLYGEAFSRGNLSAQARRPGFLNRLKTQMRQGLNRFEAW